MSFEEIRVICGLVGMIIFIGVFVIGVGWALHPKNKDKMVENGNIPFKEDE